MAVEQMLLSGERSANLDRLVERAGQLYSLPAVAIQVLRLTNEPEVDLRALRQCLENDPACSQRACFCVVNSSLFGLSRKVSDPQPAGARALLARCSAAQDVGVGIQPARQFVRGD